LAFFCNKFFFYIHVELFFELLLLFEVFVPDEFNGYGAFFQFLQETSSVHRKKNSYMIGVIILLPLSANA